MKNRTKILYVIAPIFIASTLVGCGGRGGGGSKPSKIFTVKFNCKDIKESIPDQQVLLGKRVIKPTFGPEQENPTPKEETKKFKNYYLGSEIYTFHEPVTSDITIDVSVEDNFHTVTLDPEGLCEGGPRPPINVLHTNKIPQEELKNPTPKDVTQNFYGWLDEKGELFNVDTPITEDRILKPGLIDKWITITGDLNVDFDTAKESAVQYVATIQGESVNAKWTVYPGYEDLISIDQDGKLKVNKDATNGGEAYFYATYTHSNGEYIGLYKVSIGSYNKLDTEELKKGIVKPKGTITGNLVIPAQYYDKSTSNEEKWVDITSIPEDGFKDQTSLTGVVFGDNIQKLGESAFKSCKGLTKVTLNDGLEEIGNRAFEYCEKLTYIHIPSSVKTINAYAFVFTGLEKVLFACTDSWKYSSKNFLVSKDLLDDEELAAHCLTNLYCDAILTRKDDDEPLLNMKKVTLEVNPSYISHCNLYSNQDVSYTVDKPGVATVDNGYVTAVKEGQAFVRAFNSDKKYAQVEVNVKATQYLEHAVIEPEQVIGGIRAKDKPNIKYIAIPDEIRYDGLTKVTKVKGICPNGFSSCYDLESIYLPENIELIGTNAFESCSKLKSVIISLSSKLRRIDPYAFSRCNLLSYINLPDTVELIAPNAFSLCSGLVSITLPRNDNYKIIEHETFVGCGYLQSLVIPKNITNISTKAFADCYMLNEVYYLGTKAEYAAIHKEPDWAENAPFTVVHCSDGDATR